MSIANPLWGATRIHGELLKLGIDVGQTSIAKYMVRRRGPPSQGWKTFWRNHAAGVAGRWTCFSGTDHFLPAALWIADHRSRPATNPVAGRYRPPNSRMDCQPTDSGLWLGATPSLSDPRSRRLLRRHRRPTRRSLGIRDHPTSPRSPWQNGYAERLIGSIRRECLDHVVVVSEQHLRHILMCYMDVLQRSAHASIVGQGCAG